MKDCIIECLHEFGTDLGWIALPIAVVCILGAVAAALATGGLLGIPAIFTCLAAFGLAYTAIGVGGCILACL